MAQYVTTEQVDETLGSDWADAAAKPLAVQMANSWLAARRIPTSVTDEDQGQIILAGSYLAKMAANGTLYADSDGIVKRERVKADTVEVETEMADGSRPVIGDMAFVNDLLSSYLSISLGRVRLYRG
ncbi:hypothetical protein Q8G38_16010 [Halomonas venusta]|uniref:hypothetical protein n=1 Tax=Vreelandella venusta TaxID=44935 RepID=UPI00295E239C|nr:hypothetical protein [Halomonas venusta]MDW0360818.1 hypothetical protein [Halomonas venusta]